MIEPSTKVLDRIDFDYSKWVKIQVNATDEKSTNEAGEYLIEIMIRAIKAEDEIKLEKKKANRTSKKMKISINIKNLKKQMMKVIFLFYMKQIQTKGFKVVFFMTV